MRHFLLLLFIVTSLNSQASCVSKLLKIFKPAQETSEEAFDESRRSFLRGGAAAVAVAAAPGGLVKVASAAVNEAVNRTALLRRAAQMRNGVNVSGMGDYAGSLERAASQADFSGVGEILQRRAQMLSERLSKGSDLFSKLPERIITEGQRPDLRTVLNSPNYQARIQRSLRSARTSTLITVKEEVTATREELMQLILENQNLSIQAFADNNMALAQVLFEMDTILLSQWKQTLEETKMAYQEHSELVPSLNTLLDEYIEEVDQVLRYLEDPQADEAVE